jgi:hypothetical protein
VRVQYFFMSDISFLKWDLLMIVLVSHVCKSHSGLI